MAGKVVLEVAAASHPGRIREKNEDMAYTDGIYYNNLEHPEYGIAKKQTGAILVYAVFDGMGGENSGEKASYEAAKLLDNFNSEIKKTSKDIFSIINGFKAYIADTNEKIYELWAHSFNGRMGSTFAGLVLNYRKAVALNLGDSRVYFLRRNTIIRLTKDHTEAERLAALGLIKREDIGTHKKKHVLTRHFGTAPEEGVMEADFSNIIRLKKGDTFLLCSDGLTDMVNEDRIKELLCKKTEAAEITKSLLEEALKNGGKDNITAVVVRVESFLILSVLDRILIKQKKCNTRPG